MTCREDDAAAALTSGTAFKRKVQAMCGRALPAAAPAQAPGARQPSGCPPGRQGMQSVGAVAARPMGDFLNKIGEGIFVGTFRGEPFRSPNTAAGTNNRDILHPNHDTPGLNLLRSQMFPGPKLCAPVCKLSLHLVAPILKRTSSHLHGMLSRTCTAHMALGVAWKQRLSHDAGRGWEHYTERMALIQRHLSPPRAQASRPAPSVGRPRTRSRDKACKLEPPSAEELQQR